MRFPFIALLFSLATSALAGPDLKFYPLHENVGVNNDFSIVVQNVGVSRRSLWW